MLGGLVKRLAPGRMMLLVVVGVVLVVLFLGLGLLNKPSKSSSKPGRPGPDSTFEVSVEDSRKVAGFVESYGREIDETRRQLVEREKEIEDLRKRQEKYDEALRILLEEAAAERTRRKERDSDRKRKDATDDGSDTTGRSDGARSEYVPTRIQKVTLASGKRDAERRSRKNSVRIPAGSFAEGTLLTGVYAPTEGGALPVEIRLDLAWIGPNRSRVPIQEAFLIGKAQGDANSRRVVVQITKLSYVKEGGETIEVPLNGYVTDDDGVLGIGGQYVWRIQETAALSTGSGFLSAASEALAQKETTTQLNPLGGVTQVVTGDVLKFGAFRGAGRAADEFNRIVVDRLNEVVPAIYVANGKKVTVCLLDGVTLEGLLVSEVKNANSTSPYSGLDLDR